MKVAIITGASSGLGKEYVKELGRKEPEIDEIWAIARRKDRLKELGRLSRIPVRELSYDLAEKSSIDALSALLAEEKPDIRILITVSGAAFLNMTSSSPRMISSADAGIFFPFVFSIFSFLAF